jgi:hypothetical protein
MLGFLADISNFSWLISVAIVAISFLPLSACAFAAIWIAEHHSQMHASNHFKEREHN